MTATTKAIIEKYGAELNKNGLGDNQIENIVRDAIKENVLDDVLDSFYAANIDIPPEVVAKQLCDFYIAKIATTDDERAQHVLKFHYLINIYQKRIIKSLVH